MVDVDLAGLELSIPGLSGKGWFVCLMINNRPVKIWVV